MMPRLLVLLSLAMWISSAGCANLAGISEFRAVEVETNCGATCADIGVVEASETAPGDVSSNTEGGDSGATDAALDTTTPPDTPGPGVSIDLRIGFFGAASVTTTFDFCLQSDTATIGPLAASWSTPLLENTRSARHAVWITGTFTAGLSVLVVAGGAKDCSAVLDRVSMSVPASGRLSALYAATRTGQAIVAYEDAPSSSATTLNVRWINLAVAAATALDFAVDQGLGPAWIGGPSLVNDVAYPGYAPYLTYPVAPTRVAARRTDTGAAFNETVTKVDFAKSYTAVAVTQPVLTGDANLMFICSDETLDADGLNHCVN